MRTKLFSKIFLCSILILFVALSSTAFASDAVMPISADNVVTEENTVAEDNTERNTQAVENATSAESDATGETSSGEEIITTYQTDYEFATSDKFYYDSAVEISEVIDGNAFAYGNSVNVTGEIYGDLFIAGNKLIISEDAVVHGNVFAFGGTLEISGICSDVYAYVSDFKLNSTAIVARNVNLAANTVTLSGQINRDANISSNNISFDLADDETSSNEATNETNGDRQEAIVSEMTKNIVIKGNLNYTSENEQSIPEEAVAGEIEYSQVQIDTQGIILSVVKSIISGLIFSFVIIMLLIWIAPKFKDRASAIVEKSSFKAFGIGLLVFFGTILAVIILLLFTAGLASSVAVAAAGLLALAYVVSNTIFSMSIGKLIANKLNLNKNVAFVLFSLLIVLVLALVRYIPYVGVPVNFITSMIGLGIIAINAFKRKDLAKVETENKTAN